MTRTIRTATVGAAVASLALLGACAPTSAPGAAPVTTVTATATVTATTAPMLVPCEEEDGSTPGQAFPCRWDAAHQGNGRGTSFVLYAPAG